jgi:hypothetical protein
MDFFMFFVDINFFFTYIIKRMKLTNLKINLGLPKLEKTQDEVFNLMVNERQIKRYLLSFNSDLGESQWLITSYDTPTVNVIRSDSGLALIHVWSPMNITFRDNFSELEQNDLNNWFFNNFKKDIKLEELNTVGEIVTTFYLMNTIITEYPIMSDSEENISCAILFNRAQLVN